MISNKRGHYVKTDENSLSGGISTVKRTASAVKALKEFIISFSRKIARFLRKRPGGNSLMI